MADSDDEFDRRRDKFRPERNDYERRGDDRRGREPFDDNMVNRSRDRRDGFDRGRRDRFSPNRLDASPPQMKRMRRDWDEAGGGRGGYPHYDVPYGGLPPPPVAGAPPAPGWTPGAGDVPAPPPARGPGTGAAEPEVLTQPAMMTFKQFLNSQDDNITDEDAIKRFGEYKMEFRKQQINEFFVQHKDEEWFRSKYHPEDYDRRREETRLALVRRCEVFTKLLQLNRVSSVNVDVDCTDSIVKLLDAAVIFLEGGSEFDLKSLDDVENAVTAQSRPEGVTGNNKRRARDPSVESTTDDGGKTPPRFTEPLKLESDSLMTEAVLPKQEVPKPAKAKVKKVPRESADGAGSGSESETGSLSDTGDEGSDAENNKIQPLTENNRLSETKDGLSQKEKGTDEAKDEDTLDGMEEGEERDEPIPQALHKTQSIFLRSLPHLVTKQEVEEVCKRYPGFLRVALQDPQPERRFLRRGWVTFDRTVNVKEICWNLNNIRLRDSDIGAIVNRELKQRVRAVSGLTVHRPIARQDVKHAAKIIEILDERWSLWQQDNTDEKTDNEKEGFGFISRNPVLKGIADYLVDEGSSEEEALLGQKLEDEKSKDVSSETAGVERDDALLKVLDKLILYLRIVHSVDYYSAIEYHNEDEMPHRVGIIHARGPALSGPVTPTEVSDWLTSFEVRISPFMNTKIFLDDVEMVRLGKKNPNDEVEKFILANTQELSKDKWLCPLSGKKFKGPDFVRKHIIAKHMEKVDEVKQEVTYFNNYLKDPRRPQLPEHPSVKPSSSASSSSATHTAAGPQPPSAGGGREGYPAPPSAAFHGPLPPPPHLGYRPPPVMYQGRRAGAPPPPPQFPSRNAPSQDHFRGGDFRRGDRFPQRREGVDSQRPRQDPRGIVSFHDLDAPPDVE